MSTLQHDFNGHAMTIIPHNNDFYLSTEQIAQALEYQHKDSIVVIYNRHKELLEDYSVTIKLIGTDGKRYKQRVFNEEGVMLIAMKSNQPKAISFQKWAVKVLKQHRAGTIATAQAPADVALLLKMNALQDEALDLLRFKVSTLENNAYKKPRKRPIKLTHAEVSEIYSLREQGLSQSAIAKKIGRSTGTISYTLRGYGLPSHHAKGVHINIDNGGR